MSKMMKSSLSILTIVFMISVSGCNDGENDTLNDNNVLPIANAGTDQTVTLANGQTTINVTLDGSSSSDPNGDPITFEWSGNPDPADSVSPTISVGEGSYIFTLVVSDNQSSGLADTVSITVKGNPDEIVESDTTIGGIFEGDENEDAPEDIEPEGEIDISFEDEETNTLSDETINQAPDFSMDEFTVAYESVSLNFPELDKTSNEFAKKIINEIFNAAASSKLFAKAVYDPLEGLTPEEKDLVLRNPIKSYKSKIAADSAIETTINLFGENGYKTRSDAFRHSYWNWLMSKCCSVEWARAFATAHESQTPNNDDKRMDLNNNIIGRRVFSANSLASEAEAQITLLEYNLLWINEGQKNVEVGVDYLVYLSPTQSLTVFDDGPSYDDIYEIILDGKTLGTTPQGGSKAFLFNQIPSGTYNLEIKCLVDGTKGGCGFQIIVEGAMTLSTGLSPQVIQESETYKDQITFPVMNVRRKD